MADEPHIPAQPDAADPSMEEILASIRRILNDDDAPAAPAEPEAPSTEDEDVLVLDQSMVVAEPEPFHEPAIAPKAEPPQAAPHVAPPVSAPPVSAAPVSAPPVSAPPVRPEPDIFEPDTSVHVQAEPAMEAVTSTSQPQAWQQPEPTPELLAPAAAAAATSAVGSLVRTLAAGRATQVYSGGPTLEDMVRAELRPMLKEWLDTNLPPMVERLVRLEIERVVGHAVP